MTTSADEASSAALKRVRLEPVSFSSLHGIGKDDLGASLAHFNLGIFLPFIIAAAIKTAQGSSTVSLITTSAIIYLLLPSLGFASPMGMALGCGSMVVSHANDSYFWVVAQFSNIPVDTAYKTQTLATLVMGVVGMLTVWVLSWFSV